jgi:ribosome biogenesis protein SSF1/2
MIMQPHTASRLRERKANKLKDFVVMTGPLGVSHLFLFSQSENNNTFLRVARTPRGPTLGFKVKSYSLCKDVRKTVRNYKSAGSDYINPPLLVMNGFSATKTSDKDALLTSMFQNIFPPINAQTTRVSSIRRVLLLSRLPETDTIEIRHYAVETKSIDVSRPVKKLSSVKRSLNKRLPNMSNASDIADYLLDPSAGGYTSDSEVEEDSTVQVTSQVVSANSQAAAEQPQKRAVKLVEIGPRLELELRKIEDGLCDGKVLHHSYISKSKKEAAALEKKHKQRQSLKEQRRKEQEENVRRKKEAADAKGSRTKRGLEKLKAKSTATEADSSEDNAAEAIDYKSGSEAGDHSDVFNAEESPFESDDDASMDLMSDDE